MNSNRNNVLLINPQHHRNWEYGRSIFSVPIGLLILGTRLKQAGFHPVIIDTCIDPDYLQRIREHLPQTIYAGISAMTPQVPHAMEIARYIQEQAPRIPLVWGGIHPTLYPDSCRDPLCDVVVMGEGDLTCIELARAFQSDADISAIPGIAYVSYGNVITTPPGPLVDIFHSPEPDYSLCDMETYIHTYSLQDRRMVRAFPVHAARGCPWHCTFCINTTLNRERRYRPRSADVLLEDIEHLAHQFNVDMIILQDEEFFAHRSRVLAFLDGIEARKLNHLKFNATCRINHFRTGYIDPELLRRLKRCGFENLVFGFESGSRHCLEIIQKEITVEQGILAAQLLSTEGFKAVWGFIMAIPGERRSDLIRTLHLMEKLRRMSRDFYFIGPQIFRPYPGSLLYRKALAHGLQEPSSLSEWANQTFTEEGWTGDQQLLWINPDDRDLIDYVNFIGPIHYNRRYIRESRPAKLFHALLRLIFHFRLSLDCWAFPVEHKIRNVVKALRTRSH